MVIDRARRSAFLRASAYAAPMHAIAVLLTAAASTLRIGSVGFGVSALGMMLLSACAGSLACRRLPPAQRGPARLLWTRVGLWLHTPWLLSWPMLALTVSLGDAGAPRTVAVFSPLYAWCVVIGVAWACWRWSWRVGVSEAHGAGLPLSAADEVWIRIAGAWTLAMAAAAGFVWFVRPAVGV